jgi:ribosome-interacting GTPase 1
VLRYKGAKIQLLDLPGIIEGAKDGKGRGKQVIAVARTCNLIIIVLDATRPMGHKKIIEHELEGFGIRLNKVPPEIDFKRKDKGGISISRMVETDRVNDETIKAILKEYRINNADILIKCDATEDDIIDVIEGNRKYIPCLYALNKIDAITLDELNILDQIQHYVPIAGDLGWNLDELIERMWEYLDLIRVYTKPKGKDPDYEQPVIIQRSRSTIEDFCHKIHRNMIKDFRYAMVWGTSVKFNPQKVGKEHQLLDEDVVQIIKKL